ncbi:MAG: hypothetical protein JXX28_08745 [Deltaproteobacteria bacterium]|nr:hypothetical protein [Deltaproteobacteria bacterium]
MLPAEHPLASLQAAAALASGWPVLTLLGEDQGALEERVAALEERFGALPQAEAIAPWGDELWQLRVELPGLGAERWEQVRAAFPEAILAPGPRPGVRACEDQGQRVAEVLQGGGLEARLYFDADHGGVLEPEWRRSPGDEATRALGMELAHALQAVDPRLGIGGEVEAVVDRATGRFGVQLGVPDAALEALEGDQLQRLREGALAALASVIRARAEDPLIRLAPDLLWDTRAGLGFTLWLVAPAAQALPGDEAVLPGQRAGAWRHHLDGMVEELEVQLVPAGPEHHDLAVEGALRLAERYGLHGAPPRWLRWGEGWAFAPAWVAPASASLEGLEDALAALPGVGAVRVVPGEPAGLGEVWRQGDPAWFDGGRVCFLRVRDGLESRDRLHRVHPREKGPRDLALEALLYRAAEGCERGASVRLEGYGLARPVADTEGREGLELLLDGVEALDAERLGLALRALCAGLPDEVAGLGTVAFREGAVVRLWFKGRAPSEGGPEWV